MNIDKSHPDGFFTPLSTFCEGASITLIAGEMSLHLSGSLAIPPTRLTRTVCDLEHQSGCKQGKVLHHSAVTFRIAMIGQLMASRLQYTGKMKECLWNNYKKGTSSTTMRHLIYISKLVVVRPGFQYTNTKGTGNPENQFPILVRIA